jgi:signal transduction histidine kinase
VLTNLSGLGTNCFTIPNIDCTILLTTATVGQAAQSQSIRILLQRALGNLVSNALAHCSNGDSVSLSARRENGGICIEVSDTGSGISAEVLPRIFDRFYRADAARSRNSGGAGLGLAIVQQIVFLHGGDLRIASEPGRGTTVSVLLPQ